MKAKAVQSSFRDRTQEFLSVSERLRKSITSGPSQNGPSSSSSRAEDKRSVVAHQSEFNRRASKIGFGIHQTSQKLSKLAKCKYSYLLHLIIWNWFSSKGMFIWYIVFRKK